MIDFMVWLQQFRNPVLNFIVEGITITAEENLLLLAICLLYWCYNKKTGYVVGLAVVLANGVNNVLKSIFQVDRPWLIDDRIIPIRQHTATESSFPSGHTQSGATLWYALALCIKKKWFTVVAVVMMLLIAISRVYLSVHTPMDVGASLLLAIAGAYLAYYLVSRLQEKGMIWGLVALSFVLVVVMFFIKTPTFYKMTGVILSFFPSYLIENKHIRFVEKTKWWKQILKVIIGLVVAFGIRLGLGAIFPEHIIFGFIRYFLLGIGILVVAPWIYVKTGLASVNEKAE